MTVQYGDKCASQWEVYERRMDLCFVADHARSGLPFVVTCVGAKEKIYQRIRDNHTVNTDEVVS